MIIHLKNKDKLLLNGFKFKCCIGKNGAKKRKIEGDNSTPKGIFKFGTLYYRKDRVKKPNTKLKTKLLIQIWVGAMILKVNITIKKLI